MNDNMFGEDTETKWKSLHEEVAERLKKHEVDFSNPSGKEVAEALLTTEQGNEFREKLPSAHNLSTQKWDNSIINTLYYEQQLTNQRVTKLTRDIQELKDRKSIHPPIKGVFIPEE